MNERPPYETAYPALNAENVVPADPKLAARWTPTMEKWGKSMKTAVENLAEMTAIGLGLPQSTFKDAGRYGWVTSPFFYRWN
jgi:isopenicillin N synthase-like dioxygenase